MNPFNEKSIYLYAKSIFGEDNPNFHLNETITKQVVPLQKKRTISYCTQKKSLFSDSSDGEEKDTDTTTKPNASSHLDKDVNKEPTREFCPYPPSLFQR